MTTLVFGSGAFSWRRLRPLLVPTVMTVVMLALLLGLGAWQMKRLSWKEAIIARIAAAERAPAAPLPAQPEPFQKVFVSGHFLAGPTALYGVAVHDRQQWGVEGGDLLVPFRANDGTLMLVDRGWVPHSEFNGFPEPTGETTITGFTRAPESHWVFGAQDDAAHRQFFTLDPARIAAALGLPKVAPYTLVVMGPDEPGEVPIPTQHLPHPLNNHLNYAMTWFGLAGALLVIFVYWVRGKLTEPAA